MSERPSILPLTYLKAIGSNCYKHLLGRFLGMGLRINRFAFPEGYWPVPTPARHYIETFLNEFDSAVRGRVVEFIPPFYQERFTGRLDITSYDVWDIEPSPSATIIADLQSAPKVSDKSFDTILCTHVLCNVQYPWLATQEMHRLLDTDGIVLCTVPMVLQGYAPHPGDYYRFTRDSLQTLFGGFSKVEYRSYGNSATASGSPQYLMCNHYSSKVLNYHDPNCPSIVAVAAWK